MNIAGNDIRVIRNFGKGLDTKVFVGPTMAQSVKCNGYFMINIKVC